MNDLEDKADEIEQSRQPGRQKYAYGRKNTRKTKTRDIGQNETRKKKTRYQEEYKTRKRKTSNPEGNRTNKNKITTVTSKTKPEHGVNSDSSYSTSTTRYPTGMYQGCRNVRSWRYTVYGIAPVSYHRRHGKIYNGQQTVHTNKFGMAV